MKNFFRGSSNFLKLPTKPELNQAFTAFSKKEWRFFSTFALILLISTLGLLNILNNHFIIKVPMQGGSLSEGIVGSPRFINPVLAFSSEDDDLVSLIYSGLMRKTSDGTLVPDLAESYEVSVDGLTYTFTLKSALSFHDGEPLTADDVIFTLNAVKDPIIKSPQRVNWEGVIIEKVDERTITFTLRQPYASFLSHTTLGILPEHVWADSPIELNTANTNPVGSGPFKVESLSKQSSGVIDHYALSRFDDFSLGRPYIKNVDLHFYTSEEEMVKALKDQAVMQASSISPENANIDFGEGTRLESATLPRVFGLFFNQNQNQIFLDKNVVRAINLGINKERIVEEVLLGYGVPIEDPIPPTLVAYTKLTEEATPTREANLQSAREILAKDGWVLAEDGYLQKTKTEKGKKITTTLEFSISTGNAPELSKTADIIKNDLALLGMKVDVKTFETGNLNQSVIRPRKYDALLFGQIINSEADLFAFWHSSQRKDPGLNVAMYTNAKVDKILEDAFVTVDAESRTKKYTQFEDEIKKDLPAVFIYSPSFVYLVEKNLQGLNMKNIVSPADRFAEAHLWYTETDNVWKIFAKNE